MKIPQLTFTRFLAALSVVILHYGLFVPPINSGFLFNYFVFATSCVSYFFLLSGFIMVVSNFKNDHLVDKIDKKVYWRNRFARIYPMYVFALLVFIVVNIRVYSWQELKNITPHFLYAFTLTQAWNYKLVLDVNFPSWSLSVEAFFYLLFPFIYVWLLRTTSQFLIFLSFLCWIGNSLVFYFFQENNGIHHLYHYNPFFHLATFVIGVNAGLLFIRHHSFLTTHKQYVFGIFVILFLILIISIETKARYLQYQHNGMFAPLFIGAIYSLALLEGKTARILGGKFPVYLGDISYALYILQAPVMYFFIKYNNWLKQYSPTEFFYLYLISLLVVTVLSHHLVERPARRWLKS